MCVALRGTGGDVVILEEANYIDAQLLDKVIVPLLLMKDAVCIAITSPSDESTNIAQQATKKILNSQEFIWHTIRSDRCELCVHDQNLDDGECPHMLMNLPPHRSAKNVIVAESMLDHLTAQQEIHGKQSGTTEYLYKQYIDRLSNNPKYEFDQPPQVIHAFIDPSAGGLQSDFVIADIAYEKGKVIILGLDYWESVGTNRCWNECIVMMLNHVRKVLTTFPGCHMWIYIEANLNFLNAGMYGQYIEQMDMKQYQDRVHIVKKSFEKIDSYGVWTDEVCKHRWAVDMVGTLSRNELCYARKFIHKNESIKEPLDRLETQAKRYARIAKQPTDHWGKVQITYTGKHSGDRKDDCITAVEAGVSCCLKSRNDPVFIAQVNALHLTRI